MKQIKILGILAIFTVCAAMAAKADPARVMNYQGRLTDNNGVPIADGNYDMTFKIYDALAAGTLLWTEVHNGANQIAVTDGLFSTTLGDITALISFTSGVFYIETVVGATTYSPRSKIAGSATAINSDLLDGYHAGNANGNVPVSNGTVNTNLNADLLDGYTTGNGSGNIPLSNGTLNTNLNADLLDGKHYSDATSEFVNISGDTMTGRLEQSVSGFKATDKDDISTRTDSGFYQSSSPTTAEGWPVNGSWYHLLSTTHTNDANYYSMQFASDFFSNTLYYRSTNGSGATAWNKIWHDGNDANAGSWTLSGTSLYPDSTTYNVAIGGSSPSVKLHVTGNEFIDTTGNTALERSVTIKTTGQAQLNFGSYPGNWTSALQIQNNDNTRQVWISPLDNASGANARIRTGATGLDIYNNGTAVDTGTLSATFSGGNVTTPGELLAGAIRTPSTGYGSGAALDVGDTAVDYTGSSGWAGTWNSNILLSGLNSTSISFHDSGASVATLRYTGNNFYIGENVGWGVSNLTVGGNLYFPNYGIGVVGTYSDVRYQTVFSMGQSWMLPADGSSTANFYGIAWTHSNIGGQSKPGLEHQALFMNYGTTMTAIGNGIWTNGNISLNGQLQADKVCYFTGAFTVNGSTTSCAAGYCVNAVINDTTKMVMASSDYNQRGVTQFGTGRLECCRCSISYP